LFDQIITVLQSSQLWQDGPNMFTPKCQQTATIQRMCKTQKSKKTYYIVVEA